MTGAIEHQLFDTNEYLLRADPVLPSAREALVEEATAYRVELEAGSIALAIADGTEVTIRHVHLAKAQREKANAQPSVERSMAITLGSAVATAGVSTFVAALLADGKHTFALLLALALVMVGMALLATGWTWRMQPTPHLRRMRQPQDPRSRNDDHEVWPG